MYSSSLIAALALVLPVLAVPVKRAPEGITDTVILQYALTLEHLENAFYKGALEQFDADAFTKSGYPSWVRGRFEQIAGHEASHVALIAGALGSTATMPCNYSFPYTDPTSFVALAGVLENVGTSAYLGAAGDISDAAYITIAGSILTTEARHQAWIQSAVEKENPWSSPYDTPLKYAGVYSLAAAFITGCPSSNPTFPFSAFPTLTASSTTAGQWTQLTYDDSTTDVKYLIVYYGLTTTAVAINEDKSVTLPAGLQGTSYAVVSTSSNTTSVDPSTIIAGPAILLNPFDSAATNPDPADAGQ